MTRKGIQIGHLKLDLEATVEVVAVNERHDPLFCCHAASR
jgi:hypothetical protein